MAGDARQLGCDFASFGHDPFPPNFPPDGNRSSMLIPPTPGVYAASIPGVLPSACITWFQSQQACLLSHKCLLGASETVGGSCALIRSGYWESGSAAGVFAVGGYPPQYPDFASGLRCAR